MIKGENHKALTPQKAMERLQYLCARQEKCTHDLVQKLKQWGFAQAEIDKIVGKLSSDGYVDDNRFARLYVREKSRINKWGPLKLRAMLASKGIAKDIIDQALNELSYSENPINLFDLLNKKMPQVKAKNRFDLRNKLIRFGASRGFALDEVIDTVNRLLGAEE
ncbi:regulatory protein RecX [Tenuifilum osseticum]|uniref:regulatory protein RecX n=1 Tax=Tenuifilum osseticum TaxID=3374723 RepID=UPI0034E41840